MCTCTFKMCRSYLFIHLYVSNIWKAQMCSLYHNKYWSAENDLRSKIYIHANCMIIQYITVFICPTVNNVF